MKSADATIVTHCLRHLASSIRFPCQPNRWSVTLGSFNREDSKTSQCGFFCDRSNASIRIAPFSPSVPISARLTHFLLSPSWIVSHDVKRLEERWIWQYEEGPLLSWFDVILYCVTSHNTIYYVQHYMTSFTVCNIVWHLLLYAA